MLLLQFRNVAGAAAGRVAARVFSHFVPPAHYLCCVHFTLLQVQRPGVEPLIFRDIFLFRTLGTFVNAW